MTFRINERTLVRVEFKPSTGSEDGISIADAGWKEFPAHNGNFINLIHISAAANMRLPTMRLLLTDNLRFFEWLENNIGVGIADGAHIRVTITEDVTEVKRYFRVYSWNKSSSGDLGYTYEFTCYWDSVRYWLQSTRVGMKGTSSKVLKDIGTSWCKLYWYEGNEDGTTDEQVWLPANRPFSVFARSIAQCGFKSNSSHMIFGVDSKGYMRYMDLNKETSVSSLKKAVSLQSSFENLPGGIEKLYVAQEFVGKTRAGIANTLGGYAYSVVEQFLPKPKTTAAYIGDLLSQFDTLLDSKETSRNPYIPSQIEDRSIIDFRPIGVADPTNGTVNPKYELGRAQNFLFNLLNSTVGEFAFHRVTDWELGDRFYYRPPYGQYGGDSTTPTLDKEFAGEFSVTSKTIFVSGTSYIEKVVACRNGLMPKT